jgi:Arc/MetJ-type ribon-helix-helix transcriptional regulator
VKLEEKLLRAVEGMVERGRYRSKTEAFTEALKLLLKANEGKTIVQRMENVREGTEAYPSASQAVVEAHEEDDA